MRKSSILLVVLLLVAPTAFAAKAKTYQVTGPVLELAPDKIVVQKGDDKWEVARDEASVINGDLKVGSKVTIEYVMKAKSVDVKQEKSK